MEKVTDKQIVSKKTVVEVVKRMQDEYAQTGLYKSNDLHMVLGNPKNSFGFTSPAYSAGGNIKRDFTLE